MGQEYNTADEERPKLETLDVSFADNTRQPLQTENKNKEKRQSLSRDSVIQTESKAGRGSRKGNFFKEWWWTAFGGVDPTGAPPAYEDLGQTETSMLLQPNATYSSAIGSEAFGGTERKPEARLTQTFSDKNSSEDDLAMTSKPGSAGLGASIFNLCNVCMGAGCLAMPFAFKNTGVVLGLLMLTMVYVLMSISAIRLCDVARRQPNQHLATYGGLARTQLGELGTTITQFIILLSCGGIATSYFQLIGDLLSAPLSYWAGDTPDEYCNYWLSRNGIMIYGLVFELFLCALPSLYALRYVSVLAVLFMYYTTFILVFRSSEHWNDGPLADDEFAVFKVDASLFRTLSILTFAFAPHIQVVQLFSEMKDRSPQNVRRWIWASHTISYLAFGLIGAFGYYMFYGETEGNVLLNHEADDVFVTIGRVGVAVSIMAGYPTMLHPVMATLDKMFCPNREPSMWGRRLVWMVIAISITFGLAYVIDDVSIAMGLTGAGGLTAACFLLPSYLYVKTFELDHGGLFVSFNQKFAAFTFVLGICFGSAAIVVNLIDAFDGADDTPCIWPIDCPAQRCCPSNDTYGPPLSTGETCP